MSSGWVLVGQLCFADVPPTLLIVVIMQQHQLLLLWCRFIKVGQLCSTRSDLFPAEVRRVTFGPELFVDIAIVWRVEPTSW